MDTDERPKVKVHHLGRIERTAQVSHTCTHCKSEIKPGQRYSKSTANIDGKLTLIFSHLGVDDCVWGKK